MSDYQADPSLIDVPLHLSEIEAIAADQARALKDPRKTMHFVQRTLSTVRMYKQQIQQLHRDVQEIHQQKERAGAATTLSPMDAVRYLSDEQLEQLFGKIARQQLAKMRQLQAEASQISQAARSELQQVRYAASGITDDPSIPQEIKAKFEKLQGMLPEERPLPTLHDPSKDPSAAPLPAVATAPQPPPSDARAAWATPAGY